MNALLDLASSSTVAASIGVAIIYLIRLLLDYKRNSDSDEPEETAEQRVKRLTSTLNEAAQVVDDIQVEIRERQKIASKLQEEIQTYENLKQVNKREADAIAQMLGGVVKGEGRRSLWRDIGLFVAGVFASVVTTLLLG